MISKNTQSKSKKLFLSDKGRKLSDIEQNTPVSKKEGLNYE